MDKQFVRTKEAFQKIRKTEKAFTYGNFDNINFFLKFSGPDAINYALEWVSFYGRLDLVKKCLDFGADVNASSLAALQMACKNGHLAVAKYLVEKGANFKNNIFLLTEAVENNHSEILKYLLSIGYDVHVSNDEPIRTAVEIGNLELVKLLAEYGANTNIFDGYLVDRATTKGLDEIAKFLNQEISKKLEDGEKNPNVKYIPIQLRKIYLKPTP